MLLDGEQPEQAVCRSAASLQATAEALHQQAVQQGFQAALAVDRNNTNAWLGIAESELTLGRMAGRPCLCDWRCTCIPCTATCKHAHASWLQPGI